MTVRSLRLVRGGLTPRAASGAADYQVLEHHDLIIHSKYRSQVEAICMEPRPWKVLQIIFCMSWVSQTESLPRPFCELASHLSKSGFVTY